MYRANRTYATSTHKNIDDFIDFSPFHVVSNANLKKNQHNNKKIRNRKKIILIIKKAFICYLVKKKTTTKKQRPRRGLYKKNTTK